MLTSRSVSLTPPQYRAALALAEAIIPGSASIPAADEATFARACEVVGEFHPTLARAWATAQRALDAASVAWTGRAFHALDASRQDELLLRWQRDPRLKGALSLVALVYKFVHFDRPEVYGALGGKLNVVRDLEQPRWLAQVQRADTCSEDDLTCDVVVVGTGAGGAVVGRELADRGFAVLFLEEGEHYRRDAFDGSSVSAHRRFYRGAFSVGNVPIPIFVGRLVGGSTAINGGTCFRTPPWVLDRWCDELGTDELSPSAMQPFSSGSSVSSRCSRRLVSRSARSPTSWRAGATPSAGAIRRLPAMRPGATVGAFAISGAAPTPGAE